MSLFNPEWQYVSAEESRKPNYLRNKFNRIRKAAKDAAEAQKKADEEVTEKVTKMKARR